DVGALSAQLRSDNVTVVDIKRLPFQMASLDTTNRIDITADSPIVNLPEGNSFVAALLLPEQISRFTFELESVVGRTVFVPSVIFLNESFQEVDRIDDAKLNDDGFFFMQKTLTDEMQQQARYILVYSKESTFDGKSEIVNLAREYELKKGKVLSEASHPKLYTKHSPIGHLNIRFKDVFVKAVGHVVEEVKQNNTPALNAVAVDAPVILSDTEEFYLEQISKALKEGNNSRAKSLVAEAERAGSTKAKSHYLKELDKLQQ
ncbi:MAG: maltose operon protein, partial [Psychromonas sp.]|uniref:MalM family protein n=1 Tax=Psychromonas sp. TaxID=1884585 RepID=UPI0039E257B1